MTPQVTPQPTADSVSDESIPRRVLVLGLADEAEEMAAALRRLGMAVAVAADPVLAGLGFIGAGEGLVGLATALVVPVR